VFRILVTFDGHFSLHEVIEPIKYSYPMGIFNCCLHHLTSFGCYVSDFVTKFNAHTFDTLGNLYPLLSRFIHAVCRDRHL